MVRFATLGPAGSNHEINVSRYLKFHELEDARVLCAKTLDEAFELMVSGAADYVVQACLHPQVGACIGRHHPRFRLVDTFLGPTTPMGVLTRTDVARPRSLGLMPATRVYFDASPWPVQVELPSGPEVARQLVEGAFDSGFTELGIAQKYPGRFRMDVEVGAVDVAWLVYGREPVCQGQIVANLHAPIARQFQSLAPARNAQ